MDRQSSHEIELEAARWAARLDRGPLTAEEARALDAWLEGDLRRVGAFARARGLALYTERARALGPNYDPRDFLEDELAPATARTGSAHRAGWLAGGVAAAVLLAAAVLVALQWTEEGLGYETRLGETRIVPLADGSVMTLNTQSEVVVEFSRDRREVRLLYGEALFDVVRDPARPFEVDAGATRVRAVGTSFTVRRSAHAPVEVLVQDGEVEVAAPHAGGAPVRVRANMRLVAALPAVPVPVDSAVIQRELAWREGRIAFEGETLSQAAAQFARYSDTRIVIADPALAQERITGLFQSNDPVGFSRAVATSLGLDVELAAQEVRLSR
jgi:transmembrane sensor